MKSLITIADIIKVSITRIESVKGVIMITVATIVTIEEIETEITIEIRADIVIITGKITEIGKTTTIRILTTRITIKSTTDTTTNLTLGKESPTTRAITAIKSMIMVDIEIKEAEKTTMMTTLTKKNQKPISQKWLRSFPYLRLAMKSLTTDMILKHLQLYLCFDFI